MSKDSKNSPEAPPAPAAKTKKKKSKGSAGAAKTKKKKRTRLDSKIAWPVVMAGVGPNGSDMVLPPIVDAVIDMMLQCSRATMVRVLCERYQVKRATIDRAIALAKDTSPDEWTMNRTDRMALNYKRLIRMHYKGDERRQTTAATRAVVEAGKLAGDYKKDVAGQMTADMPAEELEKLAKELEEVANRRKGA